MFCRYEIRRIFGLRANLKRQKYSENIKKIKFISKLLDICHFSTTPILICQTLHSRDWFFTISIKTVLSMVQILIIQSEKKYRWHVPCILALDFAKLFLQYNLSYAVRRHKKKWNILLLEARRLSFPPRGWLAVDIERLLLSNTCLAIVAVICYNMQNRERSRSNFQHSSLILMHWFFLFPFCGRAY